MICVAAALIVMQRNHQLSTPSRRGDGLGWKIAPQCSEPWDEVRVVFFTLPACAPFSSCGSFLGRSVFCLTGGEEEEEGERWDRSSPDQNVAPPPPVYPCSPTTKAIDTVV